MEYLKLYWKIYYYTSTMFCLSPCHIAPVAIQHLESWFLCRVSGDILTKGLLPRTTKKMDVYVSKIALSNLVNITSEKFCSHD